MKRVPHVVFVVFMSIFCPICPFVAPATSAT